MSQAGLEVVSNPSGIYLSQQNTDSDVLAGLAVAVVMDGSRSFLIEVQVNNSFLMLQNSKLRFESPNRFCYCQYDERII